MLNTEEALKHRLSGKLKLSSLPEVVLALQEVVSDPRCGLKDVGVWISKDPPLAARVLRIANSAYYSPTVPVLNIAHAVAILGLDTLASVLMQIAVADLFSGLRPDQCFDPRHMWRHSTLTAKLAGAGPEHLYQTVGVQEAFVAGLLHDIGKFILFDHLRVEFAEIEVEAQTSGRPAWEVENEVFGFTHADVGGLVAEKWGLPKSVVRAIRQHHESDLAESGDLLSVLVAAADHIARKTFEVQHGSPKHPIPRKIVERLDLSENEITAWVEQSFAYQKRP